MEQIAATRERLPEPSNSLRTFEAITQLNTDENEVLFFKYKSKPFALLSDSEMMETAKTLIVKIHVIAGWPVPEKELKNILVDQLIKKLKESYPSVNPDEFEYAFRQNTTVKDWGKSINLILIDEVLRDYLGRRREVSLLEEKYKNGQLPAPEVSEEDALSDDDYLEANKTVFRLTGNAGLVSTKCYSILLKTGKLQRPEGDERERIIRTAKRNFFSIENRENIKTIPFAEQERLIEQDCKRIMVCEWFNLQTKNQIK